MKIKVKFIMMASLLSIFAVGCSGGNKKSEVIKQTDVIKIGGSIAKSGEYSNYGTSTENGIKIAIDEINKNGGIGGKEIVRNVVDDKGDITEAVNSYNKLLGEGVDIVIGSITSTPTLAIAEASVIEEIPVITPTGTEEDITKGKPNVFRTCFTNPYQGELLAVFAKDSLKAKTAALLINKASDYSVGIADSFIKKAEELGINIVSNESYGENDTDFKAQLTNIARNNPDILIIPEYYEKLALITPQAREIGIQATFLGGDGRDGILKTMDKTSYDMINGSYFTNHFSIEDDTLKVKSFIDKYRKEYKEDPTAFSALGFDTIYIIKQAFEIAKSESNKDRIDAIHNIDFDGITGKFKFDDENNPKKAATIMLIEDGKYRFDSYVSPR